MDEPSIEKHGLRLRPYRVVAKIKNNRLWKSIVDLYPDVKTQADAARKLKMHQATIGSLLNMQRWPARVKDGAPQWTNLAKSVAEKVAQEPGYLFDPKFYGKKIVDAPKMIELEVGIAELEKRQPLGLPTIEEKAVFQFELKTISHKMLAFLTPREEQIVRLRYGIGEREHTYQEIGEKFAVTDGRIREIEMRALSKLRKALV